MVVEGEPPQGGRSAPARPPFETLKPMNWLFELSAACALVALVLPVAFKLFPPRRLTLRPARAKASPRAPLADSTASS
jgi:hypothetical protein